MRTARALTVSWGGCTCLVRGGVPAWSRGGVPAWSRGGYLPGPRGVYLPGPGGCTCLVRGGACLVPGGCTCLVPGGVPAWSQGGTWSGTPPSPPWTEFLSYPSENITLPQTSFAGGNNSQVKFSVRHATGEDFWTVRAHDLSLLFWIILEHERSMPPLPFFRILVTSEFRRLDNFKSFKHLWWTKFVVWFKEQSPRRRFSLSQTKPGWWFLF